jgi:predicted NBD/HSP70 family sugar kinase
MLKPNGVPILIRRTHEERILGALRDNGPLPRSEIELRVGLSRTTVSEITGSLLARGAIVETDAHEPRRGRGRPAARLALDPTSGQFLGIDFGHRRVYVATVNASNEIIGSGATQYAEDAAWPERIDRAFDLITRIESESGIRFSALEAVGIGVSGPVGPGANARASRWSGAASRNAVEMIHDAFVSRFDAPILIDNNTRFAGLAEAVWDRSDDVDSLLYVRLADGVGGGLVVGGRLVVGSFGMAGEIGHVSVPSESNQCWCGKSGCLETVASVPAIIRAAQQHVPSVRELADVADAIGDPGVLDAVTYAARSLADILATVSAVVDPREIVVAGDVLRLGPVFFDAVLEQFAHATGPELHSGVRLRPSTLDEEAGALGAIAAAFHRSPLLAGYRALATPNPATARPVTNAKAVR